MATKGCLDRYASVAAVMELRNKGIKTVVVGFGAETVSGDAPETLNAMADEGGFAVSCPNGTDQECRANGPCSAATRLCTKKYYQATNQAELEAVLGAIFFVP